MKQERATDKEIFDWIDNHTPNETFSTRDMADEFTITTDNAFRLLRKFQAMRHKLECIRGGNKTYYRNNVEN